MSEAAQPLSSAAGNAVCCGLCGGGSFDVVQRQSLALTGLGRHDLAFGICDCCGHVQQTPPVPEPVMLRHYETMSNYTAFADKSALRCAPPGPQTRRLLSIVRDTVPTPGRIYEIGCATGLHLHQFRADAWSVGGCDPSSLASGQARDIYGIAIDVGGEADCLPYQSGLDVVLMSHVLEHLYDPAAAMARAHAALRPGGHVILEVPCAIEPALLPPGWFSFEHLHYFSVETLSAMLQAAGFEVVETRVALRAFIYPVVAIAARKAAHPVAAIHRHGSTGAGRVVRDYVERERRLWERAKARLAPLNGSAFIWGAGVHTAQLLHWTGIADRVELAGIIDRDAQKWGLEQAGVKVIGPHVFFADERDSAVIVSSFFAEREIALCLREAGVSPDRIVTLYD